MQQPSEAEQAVIERFGIFDEERVIEEVARALEDACGDDATWLTLAAAAVAAYRATQDGGAEEAVRRVEAVATVWEGVANTWQETADHPNTGPEFRAHCLAERDDFRDRVSVLRAALAPQAGDLATDLANQGLRSCCGQPSADHCK